MLYSRGDPETYWLNELRADQEKLYWTRLSTDEYCTLESFNFRTREICQIYSAPHLIVLGGDNDYLAWYDEATTDYVDIKFYDTSRKQVSTLSHHSLFFHSWSRPSICKNKLLTLLSDGDQFTFSLLDITTGHTQRLFIWPQENGCVTPQLNERYVIWQNDFGGTLIYVYDIERDQVFDIDTEELGINYVSSIRLADNVVYLNTRSNVWYLRLDARTYGAIAQDRLNEMNLERNLSHEFALEGQQVFLLRELSGSDSGYYGLVVRPK